MTNFFPKDKMLERAIKILKVRKTFQIRITCFISVKKEKTLFKKSLFKPNRLLALTLKLEGIHTSI